MSSHSNRRIRAQRRRHTKRVTRLQDRIRTFAQQGREKEAAAVRQELAGIVSLRFVPMKLDGERISKSASEVDGAEDAVTGGGVFTHKPVKKLATPPLTPARRSIATEPTSPAREKQDPKVHGVNAQRETKARPTVGGARGKRKPAS